MRLTYRKKQRRRGEYFGGPPEAYGGTRGPHSQAHRQRRSQGELGELAGTEEDILISIDLL